MGIVKDHLCPRSSMLVQLLSEQLHCTRFKKDTQEASTILRPEFLVATRTRYFVSCSIFPFKW
jgi:hypothetical protein